CDQSLPRSSLHWLSQGPRPQLPGTGARRRTWVASAWGAPNNSQGRTLRLAPARPVNPARPVMKKAKLIEYGAVIDADTMVAPPDATELELEPGHPGQGDADYIRRRQELFALCRKHRLEELGPPLI